MSSVSKPRVAVFACLLLGAVACSKGQAAQASPAATEQAAAAAEADPQAAAVADAKGEAEQMFHSRCIVCHGEKGLGNGPGAAALNPKPRNYTDGGWQASVTDEQIKSVIMNGGAAVGKSPIMPASPDLQAKPEVVDELVKIVRSFKPH
jgi:mono/diheme cytochrome c family protein